MFLIRTGPAFSADNSGETPELTVEKQDGLHTWILRAPDKTGMVLVILSLRDASGKAVEGRQVTGMVWMPQMPMQGYPHDLEFSYEGGGEYSALVQYMHGGLWRITARFKDEGDRLFEQSFDFTLTDSR